LVFKQCFEIIKQGNHLTEIGLLEIIGLKSHLNLGLPVKIKEESDVKKLEYKFNGIPNPFWGFTSGEGSFHILSEYIAKQVLRFSIHLHIRDLEVLQGISTKEDKTKKKLSLTNKSAQNI